MKWRNVTWAEHVGYGAAFEDGAKRSIFACRLECGHGLQVTARVAPHKADCLACGDQPVQLILPVAMPWTLRRNKGLFA